MFLGNWVDLFIVLGVLVFLIDGIKSGFISEFFELIGFFVSLVSAFLFYQHIGSVLTQFFSLPENFAAPAGFLLVWLATESIYYLAARVVYSKIPQIVISNFVNRYLGFAPSIVNGLVLGAFLLNLLVALPVPANFRSAIFNSTVGGFLIVKTNQLEKPLQEVFAPAVSDIQKSLTFLTIVPESRQRVDLKFTQKELRVDAESESKMLALVNSERTKLGLPVLIANSKLTEVARNHSKDMFKRGYFSHYSPEGADVSDRLEAVRFAFLLAGENLAYAPDVIRAHNGLMDSPGHRRNILTGEFGKVGIGVIDGGIYGKMFTQVFTD